MIEQFEKIIKQLDEGLITDEVRECLQQMVLIVMTHEVSHECKESIKTNVSEVSKMVDAIVEKDLEEVCECNEKNSVMECSCTNDKCECNKGSYRDRFIKEYEEGKYK